MPGDGGQIRFWIDTWCGSEPLATTYPSLFMLEKHKRCVISDRVRLSPTGDINIVWDWSQLPSMDSDLESLNDCTQAISMVAFKEGVDSWRWLGDKDGRYSTKSFRSMWCRGNNSSNIRMRLYVSSLSIEVFGDRPELMSNQKRVRYELKLPPQIANDITLRRFNDCGSRGCDCGDTSPSIYRSSFTLNLSQIYCELTVQKELSLRQNKLRLLLKLKAGDKFGEK
ncbi:hypothetical protein E3N88_13277 [Mikania micrantha]|uniref:Uncharacterized protein n=1 Tax=Mikania micrantha TaxID=192012 RepID=A0A5N6P957_9ASTR|nr:hypothetical protein E3N88_13277 [Mikania micrantha]